MACFKIAVDSWLPISSDFILDARMAKLSRYAEDEDIFMYKASDEFKKSLVSSQKVGGLFGKLREKDPRTSLLSS